MGEYQGIELDELRLSGPRTRLRSWEADDAEAVFGALQPEWMRRYLAVPSPYRRDDADRFVRETSHRARISGTGLEMAIVGLEDGYLIGSAAIRLPQNRYGSADIGYWIAPSAQGNGYAAEATRVLADWALGTGTVRRVEVRCQPTNLRSARAAMSAGHEFESYRRDEIVIGGAPQDTAVFVRTSGTGDVPVPHAFPALPAEGLSDGVILLRPTEPGDLHAIIELEDDERTVEVGFSGARADEAGIARMCDRAGLDWLVGAVARMSLIDIASGDVAGTMQVRKAGPPNVGGIGYGVHPAFRGRGYTARGLRLLSQWALGDDGGFARLELGAKRDNVASQRAALSGGFEPDGVRAARLRNPDGTFSDEVRFALVAPHLR